MRLAQPAPTHQLRMHWMHWVWKVKWLHLDAVLMCQMHVCFWLMDGYKNLVFLPS